VFVGLIIYSICKDGIWYKIIRELEIKNNIKPTPIIAVTAHALNIDKKKCLDIGMNDYMSKPFTREELEIMLTKWVLEKNKKNTDNMQIEALG